MCYLARWQVIKKRRLVGRTRAVVRVETLAGLPVSQHLRFHAFFKMSRSRENEFLLSSRFAGGVEFSLFRFPLFSQSIGLNSSRSQHR
jgi:hypothetical protein